MSVFDKLKDNSVVKDVLLALGSIVFFYLVLIAANWIDGKFHLAQVYNLVDAAALVFKVATVSAIAWGWKKVVMSSTLGRDFGKVFNEGWNLLPVTEKTKWILISFLVLFASMMLS